MTADDDQPPADEPVEVEAANPTRMAPKERQAGWLLVGVSGATVAASFASDAIGGNGQAVALGAIGLGLVAMLAIAVWYGHRVITAFAAIITGFAPVAIILVPLACLGYGGYLMFRTSRAQAKARENQPRRSPADARAARAARAAARTGKAGNAGTEPNAAGTVRKPTQNRRYTPPKSKQARRGR